MAVFIHASVAMYVLIVVSTHPVVLTLSPTNDMVTDPHPSLPVTEDISGPGTEALQPRARVAGHEIFGTVVSTVLVMVWVQVAVLPFTSVAR